MENVDDRDFLDEHFLKELEKYHSCFDITGSELDIESNISAKTRTIHLKWKPTLISGLSKEDICGFCDILDCEVYKNLQKRLTNDNDLDKLASYILSKNVPVRKIHKFLFTTSSYLSQHIGEDIRTHEKFKAGYFNPQENSLIETNWKELLKATNLEESAEVLSKRSLKLHKDDALKCNVIGLYLSLGMSKARYASDVFEQARNILVNKVRKLTPEERKFLVDYVNDKGENCDWRELGYILYKKYPKNIVSNLQKMYKRECFKIKFQNKRGRVTLSEDKLILDFMFPGRKPIPANSDCFMEPSEFGKILGKQLGRNELSTYRHWHSVLKPWLLQYHAGTLHLDVKRLFLNYLNERKVTYLQDINWSELLGESQFAGHNRTSLTLDFHGLRFRVSRAKKCHSSEVTVPEMTVFVNEKHKPSRINSEIILKGKRAKHIEEVIKYYKSLVNKIK